MYDYRQSTVQSNIQPHHALTKDGWTIVSGEPKKSLRIDVGSAQEGPRSRDLVLYAWDHRNGVFTF